MHYRKHMCMVYRFAGFTHSRNFFSHMMMRMQSIVEICYQNMGVMRHVLPGSDAETRTDTLTWGIRVPKANYIWPHLHEWLGGSDHTCMERICRRSLRVKTMEYFNIEFLRPTWLEKKNSPYVPKRAAQNL